MKVSNLLKTLNEELAGQKAKRAEFIKKTYEQKWGRGVPDFTDIDKFVEKLGETDPSTNGAYMLWMAKLIIKDPHVNKPEDLYKVGEDLKAFEENKSKIDNKDVNSYKSFQDLFSVIEPFTKPRKKTADEKKAEKEEEEYQQLKKEIITVYNGPEGWIRIPETKKASVYLGQNTRWCTAAAHSSNYFDSYNKRDKLIVIYDRATKDRMQLHIESNALADVTDRHMDLKKLPTWAGKAIAKWYKNNVKHLSFKHVITLGSHDSDIAKGTYHEDVLELMKKYNVP